MICYHGFFFFCTATAGVLRFAVARFFCIATARAWWFAVVGVFFFLVGCMRRKDYLYVEVNSQFVVKTVLYVLNCHFLNVIIMVCLNDT